MKLRAQYTHDDEKLQANRSIEVSGDTGIAVISVDAFNNGLAIGMSQTVTPCSLHESFALRLGPEGEQLPLKTRYTLHRHSLKEKLHSYLKRLADRAILQEAVLVLGSATDPFHPFEGRFETSMQALEVIKELTPRRVVIQTRSPLLVVALPLLKALQDICTITIPIETSRDDMIARYTPTFPKFEERLKLIRALRNFGIDTQIQLGPLLPYGDWQNDAQHFADTTLPLVERATILPILKTATGGLRSKLEASVLGQKLLRDGHNEWLRTDADQPLIEVLERDYPEKLNKASWLSAIKKQLDMFAA